MFDHFIRKEPSEFWKCWNKKFRQATSSNQSQVVNGCQGNLEIANVFAKHFSEIYDAPNCDDSQSKQEFFDTCQQYRCNNNTSDIDDITVELVDKCLRDLKIGKACGMDGLCTESLRYAHPKLIVLLCHLFRSMSLHSFVPANFGKGIIVPLVKDKLSDLSNCNNYRAITLIAVISKLFKKVMLVLCNKYLQTDDRQFGFKKNLGCNQALFTVRSTIDFFTDRGSTVYAAALDISKAYDKVRHYKLFTALVRAGLPMWVTHLLVDWYSKLVVSVRWNESFSSFFSVSSGVRQGSTLSPALFNVFINKIIVILKLESLGCHINNTWIGCVLYADDIILMAASVRSLQRMLNKCNEVIGGLGLAFNCNKSCCFVVGRGHKFTLSKLELGGQLIDWCSHVKYLGISIFCKDKLRCDNNLIARKFYAASNCIFSNTYGLDEILKLSLQQSYCLPILQYGLAALRLTQTQVKALNVCWNDVFRKIFKFNRWESVSQFIDGLGYLNFTYLWYLSAIKLLKGLRTSNNLLLRSVFNCFVHGTECKKLISILTITFDDPISVIVKKNS